jgi:hypothetical protein
MGNPNIHDHTNLPLVLAGGRNGGRHLKYATAIPLANVHLTLLEKVGVRQDKFGDSNSVVEDLL